MDQAVRRYVARTLLLHLAFLLAVLAVVALSGQAIYASASDQAEAQALERLRQPANQAADALRRHVTAIYNDLAAADTAEPDVLWRQVRRRASNLLLIDVAGDPQVVSRFDDVEEVDPASRLVSIFPADGGREASDLVARHADWLRSAAASDEPGVRVAASPDGLAPAVLVAAATTFGDNRPGVLVAAVPLAYLNQAFIRSQSQPDRLGLLLLDGDGRLIAGGLPGENQATPTLEGLVNAGEVPKRLGQFIADSITGGSAPPDSFGGPVTVGGFDFDGSLALVTPVRLLTPAATRPSADDGAAEPTRGQGNQEDEAEAQLASLRPDAAASMPPGASSQLWIVALLNRAEVIEPLARMSRGMVLWAVALIIAVTAILVSSSFGLIRGRSRLERLRSEVVDKELREARQIQLRWLPDDEVHSAGSRQLQVAAANVPASHISGDFYNYFDLPEQCKGQGNGCAALIGDVTGHGMAAAFLMSTTQVLLRTALGRACDPGQALTEVNDVLARQKSGDQFVTVLAAVLEPSGEAIEIASAGHAGPLVCDADGIWTPMEVEGELVLGVMAGMEYPTHTLPLEETRALLFFTDGAVEAQDTSGDRFSLRELAEGLRSELPAGPESAKEVVDAALRVVRGFAGGQPFDDDVTLMAVVLSPAPEAAPEVEQVPAGTA